MAAAATAAMHLPSGGGENAMTVDQSASTTTIRIASSSSSSSSSPSLLSRAATFARTLARKAAVSVLTAGPLPSHVAFIMDGNRRFAESRLGVETADSAAEGHAAGYAALLHALEWCLDLGVRTVSVFAFSVDNFSRPKAEVDALMELAREKLGELAGNNNKSDDDSGPTAATAATATATTGEEDGGALLQRHGVQLRVLGELSLLPPAVVEAARAAERATEGGDRARLNVCLAYSSTRELADAVAKLSSSSVSPQPAAAAPAPASPTTPLVGNASVAASSLAGEELQLQQRQQQGRSPPSLTPSPAQSPLPAAAETETAKAATTTEPAVNPLCPPNLDNSSSLLDRALYTAGCPPVDLLLRTSGESRLSDFLLWQARHAALVFAPRLWPELRFLDVARAVVAFQRASPRLEGLRRAAAEGWRRGGEEGEEAAVGKEEEAAKTATVSRADDAAAAATEGEAPSAAAAAPPPPAAPAAPPPPPPPPARGGGGGGVPRRVRGSRPAAGARGAQAFSFPEERGGGEAASAAATATAATAAGEVPQEKNGTKAEEDVLAWASRSTWRIKRRGDAEIEDEEGGGGAGGGGPDDHGFDPHCPCCLTTGGRLIDGAANEPQNLKMPDGLEEAMLAKKRREAEVRAAMAAARAERERKAKEEEEEEERGGGGGEAAG